MQLPELAGTAQHPAGGLHCEGEELGWLVGRGRSGGEGAERGEVLVSPTELLHRLLALGDVEDHADEARRSAVGPVLRSPARP